MKVILSHFTTKRPAYSTGKIGGVQFS